jgi:hypothetical protein
MARRGGSRAGRAGFAHVFSAHRMRSGLRNRHRQRVSTYSRMGKGRAAEVYDRPALERGAR